MWSITAAVFQIIIFIPVNIFLKIFTRWEVVGRRKVNFALKTNKTLIFGVVPHATYFDVLPVPASKFGLIPVRFVASVKFFKNPILKFWFYFMGAIPAEKSTGEILEHSLGRGANLLKRENLIIFPQGHFQKTKKLLKIHKGMFYIAQLSGRPIIPTIFFNTLNEEGEGVVCFHRDWKFYFGIRNLTVVYGDPIYVQSLGNPAADIKEREVKYRLFKKVVEKMIYEHEGGKK